ncbi:MAG: SusE domain-containing protein [Gracilimonas sp.]
MKKLNLFIFVLASLFVFASCEDSLGPTLSTNIQEPSFTNAPSGESFVLTEENSEEIALELEWSKPGVGFRTEASYTVEMAEAGTEFADPASLAQTSANSISMTVEQLNNRMLAAGFPANVESEIDVRVVTEINEEVETIYSSPISMSVTPYFVDVSYPEIYLPGSYQDESGYGSEWTPQDAPALTSIEDNDQYEGYVYMANADNYFKITPIRDWAEGDYGSPNSNGTLEPGTQDNNINIADAGYYKMNVDLENLTYEVLNTDWGLIGDATGSWDNDTDMTYDPVEKVWTLDVTLSTGYIKFRANDAWNLDYGDNEGDGILEQGGSDIEITASGDYTVVLNLGEAPYTYELIQN